MEYVIVTPLSTMGYTQA